MSVYRNIVSAVEDAMYTHQYQTSKQITWYVEWWTGINNVNIREIERIVHKTATEYSADRYYRQ